MFSTCPPSGADPRRYERQVIDVAQWSEESGCKGILVYTDNSLLDPWLVSQIIIRHTTALCPLVAVQPVYLHPYSVAKLVTSIGYMYGRRLCLNMVAGGFRNDLAALNDPTPHDRRYERLVEYTTIITKLLGTDAMISFHGDFYRVDKLRLTPPLPPPLFPEVFVSASSDAGLAAARALGATAVRYPKPAGDEEVPSDAGVAFGIRIGIITRGTDEEAWEVAHARFPEDRRGQVTHQLAMRTSDSSWHRHLSAMGADPTPSPYWLGPFRNYKTFCPYLVGSYERVGDQLARYIGIGHRHFILDVPFDRQDLRHIAIGFRQALEVAW